MMRCPVSRRDIDMLKPFSALVLSTCLLALPEGSVLCAKDRETAAANLGKTIAAFSLDDIKGETVALADFKAKKAVVVLFLGTECPINNAYLPRLAELHKTYEAQGVQFVAINSNQQDSPERVAEHARKNA